MFGRQLFYDSASVRPGVISGVGDFQLNGTSQPSAVSLGFKGSLGYLPGGTGAAFTVNRTGVGVYAVTMNAVFTFFQPPVIEASNTYVTTSFWCNAEYVTGGWLNSTRTFNIHCWSNAGAAVDPPADAGNRASFYIEGLDCNGR